MIRAPLTLTRKLQPKTTDPLDFAMGSTRLFQMIKELEEMHARHQNEHNEGIKKIEQALQHTLSIKKGEQGEKPTAGVDYPIPKDGKDADHDAIIESIMKRIRQPKDGNDAVINYEKVAQLVLKLIPKPESGKPGKPGKDGKSISAEDVAKYIIENKLIKGEHIDGYDKTMKAFTSQLAGLKYGKDTLVRGGGDTVVAGLGISITNNNGHKVISSAGGNNFVYNEVVSGSGNTFTLAQTPKAGLLTVFERGQKILPTTGYTIVGAVITTVDTLLAGDITADYQY